ncbi:MAG: MORN repeat variant [Candidatus Omnitrophica bacterium ADurb.Bin292]|nr:MAG: MORN repeat variant [Candidatus Omnitrophica bacterium ADurb.Bin292]
MVNQFVSGNMSFGDRVVSRIMKGTESQTWLGGRLALKGEGNYAGSTEAVGYHHNGCLRFRYPMNNGKFHGVCRCWAGNEQLIVEEFYEHGKLHGVSKEWYDSGAIKKQSMHLKGEPCSEREWHENGQAASESVFVKGKLSGTRRAWYRDGQPQSEYGYRDGLPVWGKQWYFGGQIACEENFREGRLYGAQRGWYQNGVVKHECRYLDGMPDGVQRTWFPDAQLQAEYHYREGRRHGLCQDWDERGELIKRKYFLRDTLIPKRLERLILSDSLNAKVILSIKNAAVRRVCLESFGYARLLSQVEHKIVDRDGEQELVKLRWHPREEILCLVKVKCPSTGAFYTLRVPPGMKTVKAAVAWTFDVNSDEYDPIQET